MTTFVSQHAATAAPTASERPVARTLSALGSWVGDRARSYRAASEWHRENVDTVSPLLFLKN
jgi:hypothetical protein